MSKLPNIIQRREFEPLMLKAFKFARHYEKAANCVVSVMGSNYDNASNQFDDICRNCKRKTIGCSEKVCAILHKKAVNEARQTGGSHIYICSEGLAFWTSPFYSGERFAGAFVSGGITVKNNRKVKALANMMLICADQLSSMSNKRKNITTQTDNLKFTSQSPETGGNESDKRAENPACSIDMERLLLANLRRGDIVEAEKMLLCLINACYQEVQCNLQAFRMKAMEFAVLLSRAAIEANDISDEIVFEANNLYLNKIEKSPSLQEITKILLCIIKKMSGIFFSFHGVRHFPALRKAERYIMNNYTRKLSLNEIADVSGLSAPYFSTIFKEEMGENLSNYLNRLRTEKAATMLVTTNMSISEIAKTCGFEDQSWFSKIFKSNTGQSPGKYREQGSFSGISA
ncbi:MAG: helix-turn-helix domain-containing protein [Treponema sp.]|nr:helix-turn-helix domain-containing protein [Treponema sp.]